MLLIKHKILPPSYNFPYHTKNSNIPYKLKIVEVLTTSTYIIKKNIKIALTNLKKFIKIKLIEIYYIMFYNIIYIWRY